MQGASANFTARQRLALHVGGCSDPAGTRPQPLGRALHRCHGACTSGACLTHQKLALQNAGHLDCTLRTSRARQPTAPQGSGWRCTLGVPPTSQGPGQHSLDVRCIGATALSCPALAHLPGLHKAGHLHCTFMSKRARQPTATQGSRWRCTSGAAPTGILGTCAASMPRCLQVRRLPTHQKLA